MVAHRSRSLLPLVGAVALGVGCRPRLEPAVPGQTDVAVSKVEVEPRAGERLTVDYEHLFENLGLRAKTPIRAGRPFNPFRLAEDRRRLAAYLQGLGFFDAEVDEPELAYAKDHRSVAVTWHVHEGVPYTISQLELVGVPEAYRATIAAMVPFHVGSRVDMDIYRPLRRALAERLQEAGYGHARGYSRAFVDREHKTVAWFYYLDPGPLTRIGSIKVEGNHRVPAASILARAGLAPGAAYSTTAKRRAELALLDTGAFASAAVMTDADIQTGPPEHPETGGVLAPEQVDAHGGLVPRQLPEDLAVRLVVVEAPARQVRAELGVEGDPTRIDTYAGARTTLRHLFAPQHHLVLEASVGYGWMVDDADRDPARGLYGSAQAQYVHPGWLARTLDLRITARWRDVIGPSAMLRELVAGPGVRSTVARGVFVDLDTYYRYGLARHLPMLDAMTRDALDLPDGNTSRGLEVVGSVIADRRDDRVEPTAGWLVAARGSLSPGGAVADDRWLALGLDARVFAHLGGAWSLGLRASGGAVVLAGDSGVPLGPRLAGGGSYGMRGFGRDHLSPIACAMAVAGADPDCDIALGGKSLVEASAELRLLPFRALYGATAFVDVGGAGAGLDPTEDGVSAAIGLGGRARSWYVPIAIDVSYRLVDHGDLAAPHGLDRFLVFFRIGEAF